MFLAFSKESSAGYDVVTCLEEFCTFIKVNNVLDNKPHSLEQWALRFVMYKRFSKMWDICKDQFGSIKKTQHSSESWLLLLRPHTILINFSGTKYFWKIRQNDSVAHVITIEQLVGEYPDFKDTLNPIIKEVPYAKFTKSYFIYHEA
jgi:hypothetical protein